MSTNIGERIRQLRKEHRLNQKEFAKILNIQNTTLSQYETGVNTPSDDMKIKIADYFEVSIDYLLGRSNIRKTNGPLNSAFHSISTEGLDDKDVEMVRAMVKRLKESNKANE